MNYFTDGFDPIFRICGSKSGKPLADATSLIRGYLQSGGKLLDPFAGSGAVSLASAPVNLALSDAQPNTILFHRTLATRPLALLSAYEQIADQFLSNPSPAHYYRLRNKPPKDAVSRAAWFLFVVNGSFNTLWRVNGSGRCNSPFGKEAGIRRVSRPIDRAHWFGVSRYLSRHGVEIRHMDAMEAIEQAKPGDVVYCDPPYYEQYSQFTRSAFGAKQHIRLQQALQRACDRGATVIVHNSYSLDLAALFRDWCRVFVLPVDRLIRGGDNRGLAGEMLLVSQPKQRELFVDLTRPENTLTGYVEWEKKRMQNRDGSEGPKTSGIVHRIFDHRGIAVSDGHVRLLEIEQRSVAITHQPNPKFDLYHVIEFPRDAFGLALPFFHLGSLRIPRKEDNPAEEFLYWSKGVDHYGLRDVLRYVEAPPNLWQKHQHDDASFPECRGCEHASPVGVLGATITCSKHWRDGYVAASSPVCHIRSVELRDQQKNTLMISSPNQAITTKSSHQTPPKRDAMDSTITATDALPLFETQPPARPRRNAKRAPMHRATLPVTSTSRLHADETQYTYTPYVPPNKPVKTPPPIKQTNDQSAAHAPRKRRAMKSRA